MAKKTVEAPKPPVIVTVALDVKVIESAVFALGWSVGDSVERYRQQLRNQAGVITRTMERLEKRLDQVNPAEAHTGINSLGELQGSASELDRLCGQYAMVTEQRATLAKALDPLFQPLIAAIPDEAERAWVLGEWRKFTGEVAA